MKAVYKALKKKRDLNDPILWDDYMQKAQKVLTMMKNAVTNKLLHKHFCSVHAVAEKFIGPCSRRNSAP